MKATLYSSAGEKKGTLNLPPQFEEAIRPDLIKRAVLAIQSAKRQPYGTDPEAGKKYASKISRRRRDYKGAYGHGISRVPRKILSYRGTRFNWQGARAPNTVGGMEAHPPQAEKVLLRKINKKERLKAIRSALAASVDKKTVEERGHKVSAYPLVVDGVEELTKTKDILGLMDKLGLKDELERSSKKRENTGNASRRGRRFKKRIGPLVVVSKKCKLTQGARNIAGVDVAVVDSLNAELLAPGSQPGRLTIYTKSAIERLGKESLFAK